MLGISSSPRRLKGDFGEGIDSLLDPFGLVVGDRMPPRLNSGRLKFRGIRSPGTLVEGRPPLGLEVGDVSCNSNDLPIVPSAVLGLLLFSVFANGCVPDKLFQPSSIAVGDCGRKVPSDCMVESKKPYCGFGEGGPSKGLTLSVTVPPRAFSWCFLVSISSQSGEYMCFGLLELRA